LLNKYIKCNFASYRCGTSSIADFRCLKVNIIHPSKSRSPQWSLSFRFPHQDPLHSPPLTHTRHMSSCGCFYETKYLCQYSGVGRLVYERRVRRDMEGSSHVFIDLEGLANGHEIIIVIGLHEASVTEYLLRNVKAILIATYCLYIIIAQLAFI